MTVRADSGWGTVWLRVFLWVRVNDELEIRDVGWEGLQFAKDPVSFVSSASAAAAASASASRRRREEEDSVDRCDSDGDSKL